ncbi:universal stress protein [Daejeonella sp.]|uniref:universal stress protein n=1 Tax=Daejeonella sp. TaxID=2805397 RepID=UPI0030BBC6CC
MKTILVLIDFSKKAERAALMAMEIAQAANAQVQLYTAFTAPQVYPSEGGINPVFENFTEDEKIANGKLKVLAEKIKRKFNKQGLPEVSCKSEPGNLAENIEAMKPWLIVMGGKSEGTALSHFVFGNNSAAVMDKASCPVLIIPEKSDLKPFRKIAFATEFLTSESDALSFVESFGAFWDASIAVLHVSDPQVPGKASETRGDDYKAIISERKLHYADVRGKDIAQALSRYSDFKAINLIAIAHKKRSFIGRLLHKSIGKDLLNYQHVPVLILHKS